MKWRIRVDLPVPAFPVRKRLRPSPRIVRARSNSSVRMSGAPDIAAPGVVECERPVGAPSTVATRSPARVRFGRLPRRSYRALERLCARSSRRERRGQRTVHSLRHRVIEPAGPDQVFGELLRPQDVDAVDDERPADQWPVGLDEAQHAPHCHLDEPRLLQGSPHEVDLLVHAADELGLVTRTDHELLDPGPEQAALHAELRPALVALGVDDEHARRRHSDVVDVGFGPWDPPVVQDPRALPGQPVETFAEELLTTSAGRPGGRALGLGRDHKDQPAELWVRGAYALLTLGLAALVVRSSSANVSTGWPGKACGSCTTGGSHGPKPTSTTSLCRRRACSSSTPSATRAGRSSAWRAACSGPGSRSSWSVRVTRPSSSAACTSRSTSCGEPWRRRGSSR